MRQSPGVASAEGATLGLAWHTIRHRENIALAMVTGRKLGKPEDGIPTGPDEDLSMDPAVKRITVQWDENAMKPQSQPIAVLDRPCIVLTAARELARERHNHPTRSFRSVDPRLARSLRWISSANVAIS